MAMLTKGLVVTGLTFLIHAVYSAREHAQLSSSRVTPEAPPLPTDIIFETLISTFILLVAIVLSASPLRPIRWAEWAGKIEREGWDPNAPDEGDEDAATRGPDGVKAARGGRGNPYRALEERRGFWDVRAQRKEFADWVRKGSGADLTSKR
ncbi:MAG: hypothetical protein M1831_005918 [Alyxoria varia]|nr:MAG: hypothetical protein M1831_005918 [Alyxoria varia]